MGLKSDMKRFSNEHPLMSLFYIGVIGFTAIDLMSSFTLPRGKGPFSGIGHITSNQQTKIDKIEGELRKASKMHASQADRISQLGATTSTSTTTSSSHPPIVRESMQQHAGGSLSGFHGAGTGFHHGVGEKDSRQLPPGLRRRMMARTFESQVTGAHLGKQDISVNDRSNNNAMKNVSGMYGLSGVLPEAGGGWTE
jgi:hypothetical protein|tara:strand:+ start:427 stop:1014 length:588 start_codon:yes stop_codon:yes gene_type:complete